MNSWGPGGVPKWSLPAGLAARGRLPPQLRDSGGGGGRARRGGARAAEATVGEEPTAQAPDRRNHRAKT